MTEQIDAKRWRTMVKWLRSYGLDVQSPGDVMAYVLAFRKTIAELEQGHAMHALTDGSSWRGRES